jgi:hypothetical protein
VKRLEEDVQQIGAGGAALCKSIGSTPTAPVNLPVAEPPLKVSVEGDEGAHDVIPHPGTSKDPKQRPPWQHVETLLDVETGQPQLGTTAALQNDEVGQQLHNM